MIPHNKPLITQADIDAVTETLKSGWIVKGEKVRQFEEAMCLRVGRRYAVATNSGTSALHLILLAMRIGAGDEIIVPTYVCSAVLNPIYYVGAKPVVVDVGWDFNIQVKEVEKAITRHTKAILAVHTFGIPADIKGLKLLGVPVIEDCAQVVDDSLGSLGFASIYSFYATKPITTGGGGMLLTDNKKLYNKITDLCRWNDSPDEYRVRYNYEMNDIAASLGMSQLARSVDNCKRRQAIFSAYNSSTKVAHPAMRDHSHAFYRYILDLDYKDMARAKLNAMGITAINPLEKYELLHNYLGLNPKNYRMAELLVKSSLSIPCYPALTNEEVNYICEILAKL